jgi:glutamyl-tRNA reductase
MTLAIVHQSPPGNPAVSGVLSWRTCLRDVTFVDESSSADALAEEDAYVLLLEVLCGLRSPMLGETQVMGQFKAFLASVPAEHAWVKRIGQRLLADAGAVREQHLRNLGSRTYGSVVRHRVAGVGRIAIVGTGKLASELLCFLADTGRPIDLYGRRETAPFELPSGVVYHRLGDAMPKHPDASALVIAAPVSSAVASAVAAGYQDLRMLIDMRGEGSSDPIDASGPVVSLNDIFGDVESARTRAEVQADAARRSIVQRARQFALRDDRRPFGWDDLCA